MEVSPSSGENAACGSGALSSSKPSDAVIATDSAHSRVTTAAFASIDGYVGEDDPSAGKATARADSWADRVRSSSTDVTVAVVT